MIAVEVIGALVALPLFAAAFADWYRDPDRVRRRRYRAMRAVLPAMRARRRS